MTKTTQQEVTAMQNALPEGYTANYYSNIIGGESITITAGANTKTFSSSDTSRNVSDAWAYVREMRVEA